MSLEKLKKMSFSAFINEAEAEVEGKVDLVVGSQVTVNLEDLSDDEIEVELFEIFNGATAVINSINEDEGVAEVETEDAAITTLPLSTLKLVKDDTEPETNPEINPEVGAEVGADTNTEAEYNEGDTVRISIVDGNKYEDFESLEEFKQFLVDFDNKVAKVLNVDGIEVEVEVIGGLSTWVNSDDITLISAASSDEVTDFTIKIDDLTLVAQQRLITLIEASKAGEVSEVIAEKFPIKITLKN